MKTATLRAHVLTAPQAGTRQQVRRRAQHVPPVRLITTAFPLRHARVVPLGSTWQRSQQERVKIVLPVSTTVIAALQPRALPAKLVSIQPHPRQLAITVWQEGSITTLQARTVRRLNVLHATADSTQQQAQRHAHSV